MSFVFRLVSQDEDGAPSVAFEDSIGPGYAGLWEALGVYEALYNSDGGRGRDVSRTVAYGIDRLASEEALGSLLPPTCRVGEALRFLENVHRGCTLHTAARIETG